MQIRDPYCLSSDENRRHLAAFIRELCGILAEPGQLTVTYRHDDSTGENGYQQEQAVKKLLLLSGPNVPVTFLRTGGGIPRTTSMTGWSTSSRALPRPWRASIRSS